MNSCSSSKLKRLACRGVLPGMLMLGACADVDSPPVSTPLACQEPFTPIHEVQGSGERSPLADSRLTVQGVVTAVVPGSGIYLESTRPLIEPGASRAVFVSDARLTDSVKTGQVLRIDGRVAELGSRADTQTALTDVGAHETCANGVALPLTQVRLPLDPDRREALEGMRVTLDQELTLTDVYSLSRGQATFSSDGVLRVPTEVAEPGSAAGNLERENRRNALVVAFPEPAVVMAVGGGTGSLAGVLGHDGRSQQLLLPAAPELNLTVPALPPAAADGNVRVVSSNLLNFFNGDGRGGGFPTERGARSQEDFVAQSERIRAAFEAIQPDLLAVQELENDGFGPDSAARSLLGLLNGTEDGDWAFIDPGTGGIGGDVITVGLFYRDDILEPVGRPRVLDQAEFRGLSRQPLAQLFRVRRSGSTFLVAVNHLKSKGSCPDGGENADQDDGQGCWNRARTAAVRAEIPWLRELAAEAGTNDFLVLGDMNAWRHEDPVRQFTGAGLVDLVATVSGLPQYSFLYWGQTGTLDYAFASPALAGRARQAVIWHINADWPSDMELPQPWLRASDHDPVIVDFDFSQASTSD